MELILFFVLYVAIKAVLRNAVAGGFLPEIWWHHVDDGTRSAEERRDGLRRTMQAQNLAMHGVSIIAAFLAIQLYAMLWTMVYA